MSARDIRCRGTAWILIRWALGGVFIYAGVMKVHGATSFAASIARFQIIPESLINIIALGLPPSEILYGILLLIGPWKRQAALAVAVLCALFLAGLISAAVRGIAIECSCFGSAVAEPLWRLIVRDVLLFAAATATYLHLLRERSPDPAQADAEISVLNKTYKCLH